ncbi:myelin-associated glycoprotein-like [Hypanus sabinus]|uniref:myelin-associated glycoprotein-like n=1 Tax=Hypanus sabinus TaxID=79690 RepID=UPI0028C43FE8|nr:myelin-associated glycoprotein-like [Hypanus sabinus]
MTPALKHHGQSLTCRVRYPSVSSEQTLTLTVQYAPQDFSITSTNSVNNSWVNMKEGIPTSILCSVQSFPVSNLTWRHLGVTLNTTSSNNELWLVFPQVTPQQAGDYQCVAKNKHGTAERAVTLTVEYAPQNLSITSTNNVNNSWVNMKEGIPTSILCFVQSFPVSNLKWRHLGVTLNTTSSSNELWLEFPQVTPQQAGVYQCVAENEHGTAERAITLTVEYKPEISRDSGCTRTPEVITCVCAARSNPPGELTWHLPLANLSGNQTHGRFQTWQVADGQLVTGSLTLGVGEGEGDVTALCTVRNQHGEVMFAVSLWMKAEGESCKIPIISLAVRGVLVLLASVAVIWLVKSYWKTDKYPVSDLLLYLKVYADGPLEFLDTGDPQDVDGGGTASGLSLNVGPSLRRWVSIALGTTTGGEVDHLLGRVSIVLGTTAGGEVDHLLGRVSIVLGTTAGG